MAFLPTWTPGVKEQDELDLAWSAQAQPVAAYGRVRGAADGQLHRVPGGAGESSAPAGRVDVGRQTEGGLGAILLDGLGTCVKKTARRHWDWANVGSSQVILAKYFGSGECKLTGHISLFFFPALPKFRVNISGSLISCMDSIAV